MKNISIYICQLLMILILSCGGQVGGTEFGNPSGTGTVIIKGSVGQDDISSLMSYMVVQGTANEVLVRTYRMSLGNSSDCTTAEFTDIFDNTDDTSDCVVAPTDTSNFLDIAASPTLGSNNSFEAGLYSCVRVVMCDQLVWSSNEIDECPGTQVSDTFDPLGTADIQTFYWSTTGSSDNSNDDSQENQQSGPGEDNEDPGSAETPFALTSGITITAGQTNTIVFTMTNNEEGTTMVGEYDPDEDEEDRRCEIPAPNMTFTVE